MNTQLPDLTFKPNATPTIGVELELQLVNAETMGLESAILPLMEALPDSDSWLKPELMQCYVELNTDVCETVDDARKDLSGKLDQVYHAA